MKSEEFKVILDSGEEVGATSSHSSAMRLGQQFCCPFRIESPETKQQKPEKVAAQLPDESDSSVRFSLLELT